MELSRRAASAPRRKTGRPLSFDRDVALEQAMLTFWAHGYETTSIVDLTTAMGVTAPSLYTAFGDKKRLFLEAVARYAGDPVAMADRIAGAATSYEAARDMLVAAATAFTGKATPKGCLLASATASGSADSADVQRAVATIRGAIAEHLRARIERDIATGLLPSDTQAVTLAGLVIAVIQGLSVLARDGTPRARLIDIGKAALAAWPGR
ncbi:MAG: TetR/AcrR family transcriptional regulator [Beijerinckiaceae bacterium]|nr:TetR/AcrR family transcriptional regulator [Beijerinckiaceae bacterium]